MKDPGAKPMPPEEGADRDRDEHNGGVSPEEAIQEAYALPPSPTLGDFWSEGLKVEGVTSCLG